MTTVGYGDIVPITPVGKMFGGFVVLLGIAMFAIPAGLMATGFAEEIRRREFMVTWRAVAALPLFAHLDASRIAEIASLLKPQEIGRAHVCTPVTNAHLVCRLLLEQNNYYAHITL